MIGQAFGLSSQNEAMWQVEPAPPSTLTDELLLDLRNIQEVAMETDSLLQAARARVFGPWPQEACNSLAQRPEPACQSDRLVSALSDLRERLRSIKEHAAVLNGRF